LAVRRSRELASQDAAEVLVLLGGSSQALELPAAVVLVQLLELQAWLDLRQLGRRALRARHE
jgi:hypothetical protein